MDVVEGVFKVSGSLPANYGYPLYAAVCKNIIDLHNASGWQILPLYTKTYALGACKLIDKSRLIIRVPREDAHHLPKFTNCALVINGHRIVIDDGIGEELSPSPALKVRSFVPGTKGHKDIGKDEESVKKYVENWLSQMGVVGAVGGVKQHTFWTKGGPVPSFEFVVRGLSDKDSLLLQSTGIGKHRKMGCGSFLRLRDAG